MSKKRQVLFFLIGIAVTVSILTILKNSSPGGHGLSQDSRKIANQHRSQAAYDSERPAGRYLTVYRKEQKENSDTLSVVTHRQENTEREQRRSKRKKNLTWSKGDQYKSFERQKEVGRRQRLAVDSFCRRYKLDQEKFILPQNERQRIYQKLLLNSKTKTIFCITPKAGSTSIIVLYFIALGLLPQSMATVERSKISFNLLHELVTQHSLGSAPRLEKNRDIRTFFKFVMYRDPLERLASSYRNKIEHYPLLGLNETTPHYNWMKAKIYEHTHPQDYQLWKQNGARVPISVEFSDFVDFWLTTDDHASNNDPHFMPIFQLCEPCRIRYSYYGDFDNYREEANVLIRQMGESPLHLRDGYYSSKKNESTSHVARSLYSELRVEQKMGILKKLSRDIDFYYHIFPAKKNSHKTILSLDVELPTPPLQTLIHNNVI